MYICICNSITDTQIRAAVTKGYATLADLRENLGIASCCGSCIPMTESILDESHHKPSEPRLYIPLTD